MKVNKNLRWGNNILNSYLTSSIVYLLKKLQKQHSKSVSFTLQKYSTIILTSQTITFKFYYQFQTTLDPQSSNAIQSLEQKKKF